MIQTDTTAIRKLLACPRDHRWDRGDFDDDMPQHRAGYFESHAKTCDELDALRNAATGMCEEIDSLRRERDVLRAEVKAWRKFEYARLYGSTSNIFELHNAATAAGLVTDATDAIADGKGTTT